MLQPESDLGLQWGSDDNVVAMPQAFLDSLTDAELKLLLSGAQDYLTKSQARRAWTALGRKGQPPARMAMMLRWTAIEAIAKRLGIEPLSS